MPKYNNEYNSHQSLSSASISDNNIKDDDRPAKLKYYAVRVGKTPGIYKSWIECRSQVNGFNNSQFKSFKTIQEAEMYMNIRSIHSHRPGSNSNGHGHRGKDKGKEEEENRDTANRNDRSKPSHVSSSSSSYIKQSSQKQQQHHHDYVGEIVRVYTDGACSGNGRNGAVGGIGVWYGENDPRNLSEPLSSLSSINTDNNDKNNTTLQTNNRAEMTAVIRAIENVHPNDHLVIHSDSIYVIKGATEWIHCWKRKNWKLSSGQPVQNQDLWRTLDGLIQNRSGPVVFVHVKGHSGVRGNEEADRLARLGPLLNST